MNRHWDITQSNGAAQRFFGWLLGEPASAGPANVVRMMFSPSGLRPFVGNWDAVAEALIQRVHREAVGGVADPATNQLLDEVLAYSDVPKPLPTNPGAPSVPVIPVCFRKDGHAFNFFSTITTLGTPQDVTLQELRIECFFPMDDATGAAARTLFDAAERDASRASSDINSVGSHKPTEWYADSTTLKATRRSVTGSTHARRPPPDCGRDPPRACA